MALSLPQVLARAARRNSAWWFACAVFLVVAALSIALAYLSRFQLPVPTGALPIGTTLIHLTDSTRHDPYVQDPAVRRELVVQLWYPAAPSNQPLARYMRWSEAPLAQMYAPLLRTHARTDAPVAVSPELYPVLLFSPRWNGARTQDTALAEDLASHGYVVAAIDYPHNGERVQLADGTVVRGTEALEGPAGASEGAQQQIDFWNDRLRLWVADERFVLDQLSTKSALPGDLLFHRLNTARVGAFGHSFGGAASLALCGVDPRVYAAINMDGWTFGALDARTQAQSVMILAEQSTRTREVALASLPQPGSVLDRMDRADFADVERSLRLFGGYEMYIAGTQHMDFSDEPLLPPLRRPGFTGPTPPRVVHQLLKDAVLQFFDSTLRGRTAPLLTHGATLPRGIAIQLWPAPTEVRGGRGVASSGK